MLRNLVLALLVALVTACAAGPVAPEWEAVEGGAVATAHPLATEAGREILAQGGNAFDAAVAVSAALAVVEPFGSGVGGGGFWLMHLADEDRNVMVDGRETAPGEARADMYIDDDGNVDTDLSRNGPLAAAIPGQPAALVHIAEHYGRLPLNTSLAPAIRLASEGFEVGERYIRGVRFKKEILERWPAGASVFLDQGEVPEEGWRVKQPDLADTLRRIAEEGHDGFYRGELAQKMVRGVREAGGIWQLQDLADYRVVEREPIVSEYRGARIIAASPPSAGGVALATTLNILEGFDLEAMDSATRTHVVSEALRRAYRDRGAWLGDPDFVDMPIGMLTHPHYAAGLRAGIRLDRATPSDALPGVIGDDDGPETTHFSIIDREGNRVGGTLSINFWFGSGFMPEGTGVILNNEMDDFSSRPGTPDGFDLVSSEANAIAPGKRMLSSMTPTFVENERGVAVLGSPGGSRIITTVLHGILAYLDGDNVDAIVERRRFHHQYRPDEISFEPGALDRETIRALEEKGHRVQNRGRPWGNLQLVVWDRMTGALEAASDPRGEGSPDVY
ncbi:gamma-glutamyltransferase [Natronospira bacteriovora]|uniref:Glutathione hydrolase proenzyme n=1 Tax=Natronospira bacteriovora TaxID=3069753 RepID=A0ABU0W9A6_9GAMM|nr:gamma-glutamyltransferase [Natronospira sp. AB-CW4]MDQ2070617.1 gamma-glutamyltransferase [Natronospira sp. AB-CW4]